MSYSFLQLEPQPCRGWEKCDIEIDFGHEYLIYYHYSCHKIHFFTFPLAQRLIDPWPHPV
eukprot:c47204_g1_i1 orf=1-177(-)